MNYFLFTVFVFLLHKAKTHDSEMENELQSRLEKMEKEMQTLKQQMTENKMNNKNIIEKLSEVLENNRGQHRLDEGIDGKKLNIFANVAVNKMTNASSIWKLNEPSKAVDGDFQTKFVSNSLYPEENEWFMVDLEERYQVAQIRIYVGHNGIHKKRGGFFKVCLVDSFHRDNNSCNNDTEILTYNKPLKPIRSSIVVFEVKSDIMGRYIVIEKLQKNKVLLIYELEVLTQIPMMTYECKKCNNNSDTFCDPSKDIQMCECIEENLFPIWGDAKYGCKDPCSDFIERNSVCIPIDAENFDCECKVGFHPIFNNSCLGCRDPCSNFNRKNVKCASVDFEKFSCQCKENHIPSILDDPCFGCEEEDFLTSTWYSADDGFQCKMKEGIYPIFDNSSLCRNGVLRRTKEITIANGKAYISLGLKLSWYLAKEACEEYEGFGMLMPKTLKEYNFALKINTDTGRYIPMNIEKRSDGKFYFGDNSPFDGSGLPGITLLNDSPPIALHIYQGEIHDVRKNRNMNSFAICERKLE